MGRTIFRYILVYSSAPPLTYCVKMAAILAGNNVEEEFLWSCTLSSTNKEYSWDPATLDADAEAKEGEEKEGPKVKPGHRLLIKSAILMPSAKKDDVTVVQIESEGYNKQKVIVPICAMKGGAELQKYVDLLVPSAAKLTIIHGEGPINLVGSHCVDYFGFKDEGDEDSEDEEGDDTENEDMETEGLVAVNKASPAKDGSAKKATPSKDGSGKKPSPAKEAAEKKASPAKEVTEKKASPAKEVEKSEDKKTPSKDDTKKRKASSEGKSAEKKSKS